MILFVWIWSIFLDFGEQKFRFCLRLVFLQPFLKLLQNYHSSFHDLVLLSAVIDVDSHIRSKVWLLRSTEVKPQLSKAAEHVTEVPTTRSITQVTTVYPE